MPSNQPHRPDTPVDHDSLVVQKISQAEMLFSLGQSDQAISMLKATLKDMPSDVQVRLKLKDIYLRCDMPSEAAEQYFQIARIYNERGEKDRVKDYIVRAKRLNSSSEPLPGAPPAQQHSVSQKSEPTPATALREVVAPNAGSAVSNSVLEESRADQPTVEAVRAVPSPHPPVKPVELRPLTNQPNMAERKSQDVVIKSPPSPININVVSRQSIALPSPPARPDSNREAPAAQGALINLTTSKPTRITRRYALMIGAACLALSTAAAMVGIRAYDAYLDREYQALVAATPAPELPQPPPPDTLEVDLPVGQDEGFSMTVPLTPEATQASSEDRPGPNDRTQEVTKIAPPAEPAAIVTPTDNRGRSQMPPSISPISPEYERNIHKDSAGPTVSLTESGAPIEPSPPKQEVRKSGAVITGRILRRVEPQYPAIAREARITGTVVVEVSVDELGNVSSARAQSGPQPLRAASVAAALRWKFQPSTLNGTPVRSTNRVIFNFK